MTNTALEALASLSGKTVFLSHCRRHKTAKIIIANITYSGLLQQTIVDTANCSSSRHAFPMSLYNFVLYSFVHHEQMQQFPKMSIANTVDAQFKQNSTFSKGLE